MGVQNNQGTLSFASVSGKQVEAVFDGGVLTSDLGRKQIYIARPKDGRCRITLRDSLVDVLYKASFESRITLAT